MSIYDDLKPVVAGILGSETFKQGNIAYARRTAGTGGTPDAPAAATFPTTPLDGVVRGVAAEFVDRGLAIATDRMVTCAVVEGLISSIAQPLSDFIDVDSVRHKIVHFEPVPSAGVAVVWKFIIRR